MNIVLIGFMGTGKSSVGRLLSKRLGRPFFDTDEMIEKETGLAIADIFAKAGEPAFRDMETKTIKLVSLLDNAVISTGGGVPLREENMRELERNGVVFCLNAKPENILERLKEEIETRPLLKTKDPFLAIQERLLARRKAYSRCRHAIETDGLTAEQVAETILNLMPKAA
ncbi:MAG: shikimate kinase [Elusimicrobia bacterium]|nr:shikimate kinase [Elusimicrobiota bacterium]